MSQMLTIGETMAAFTPGTPGALRYISQYQMRSAGAESNVAIGAAKLGIHVSWLSRVGKDEFGHFLCNQIRSEGVDCSHLIYDDTHPTGIMFKERSSGETKVFYYRENSAASHLSPEDLPSELFSKSQLLHMTGITPVLSDSCKTTTDYAFSLAEQYGLLISFDPNIRKKLWNGIDYTPYLRQLTLRSHIVLIGLDEANTLFHTSDPDELISILFNNGNAQYIAIKNGADGAIAANKSEKIILPPHPCHCIEPIGAGDGFNAGFLTGILQGRDLKTAGKMGSICGALATEVPGDTEGYPDFDQMEIILQNQSIIYR